MLQQDGYPVYCSTKKILSMSKLTPHFGKDRIPDVINNSGCKMIEVGTTNKTHLKDYQDAINSNTGAIMVAHTSNYKVVGFTHSVDLSDLGKLARKKRIPLIVDLGCGALADFQDLSLPEEPTVLSYIKSAAGVFINNLPVLNESMSVPKMAIVRVNKGDSCITFRCVFLYNTIINILQPGSNNPHIKAESRSTVLE